MSIVILILCILAKEATTQTEDNGTLKAKIFWTEPPKDGSDLRLTCDTKGFKKVPKVVFVYICKNGLAVKRNKLNKEEYVTFFRIKSDSSQQSGNYSCVFSEKKYSAAEVRGTGDNSISVQVKDSFIPADISFAGLSTVSKGEDVEFKCTISDTLKTEQSSYFDHSSLCKNGTVVQTQVLSGQRMEATFIMRGVTMSNTGSYSCVFLKSIQMKDTQLYGNNEVFLQVQDNGNLYLIRVVISSVGFLAIVVLSLILGIQWLIKTQGASQCCCNRTPLESDHDDVHMTEEGDTSNREEEPCDRQVNWDDFSSSDTVPDDDTYHEIAAETHNAVCVAKHGREAAPQDLNIEALYTKICKKTRYDQYCSQ